MTPFRIAVLAASVAFAVVANHYNDEGAALVAMGLILWAAFGDWDDDE